MTEREAEESRCCGPEGCGVITNAERFHVADDTFIMMTRRWCIGSRCMGWRWDESTGLNKPTRVHPSVLENHWAGWRITNPAPDGMGYVEISPPMPSNGFCGLAGKP